MKKIFSLLVILSMFCIVMDAQNSSARFSNDATYANLPQISKTKTLASTDTVTPSAFVTYYSFSQLTAAKTLAVTISKSRLWDKLVLEFNCDTLTAGRVVTFSTNFITTSSGGTITVKKSKKALVSFIFDGTAWIEQSRTVQY